jgi:hypothetical protein
VLINFASEFKDEEDDPSLLDKIKKSSQSSMIRDRLIAELQTEIDRVVKMFYL